MKSLALECGNFECFFQRRADDDYGWCKVSLSVGTKGIQSKCYAICTNAYVCRVSIDNPFFAQSYHSNIHGILASNFVIGWQGAIMIIFCCIHVHLFFIFLRLPKCNSKKRNCGPACRSIRLTESSIRISKKAMRFLLLESNIAHCIFRSNLTRKIHENVFACATVMNHWMMFSYLMWYQNK